MRDENRGDRRWIAMTLVSLLAASGALIVSNLSCGTVATNACAQEACPGVAALEARVMELEQKLQPLVASAARVTELEQKLQPLLAIAQLSCGMGNLLAWSGAAWECTKTVKGDLEITGNATVGQELTVTSATMHFGTTSMIYSRATIGRNGTKIQYSEDGMLRQELDIGDGSQALGGGANAYIQYLPGSATGDAVLLFNIAGLRSLDCTLLHSEDDLVAYGLTFATDAGNGYASAWGGVEKRTFVLSRQGTAAQVIADFTNYSIVCF